MRPNALGVRLRHARKLRGLTQQELAKAAKVPQSAISEVETGESQSPVGTNLVALAHALQVSPRWLAHGEGQMDENGTALPAEALAMAREWLKLGPEARQDVLRLIRTMVKTSAADRQAVPDERVEAAYGKPGADKKTSRR